MDDINKPRPKENASSPTQRRGFMHLPVHRSADSGMFSNAYIRRGAANKAPAQASSDASKTQPSVDDKQDAEHKRVIHIRLSKPHIPHIRVPFAEKITDKFPILRDLRVRVSMWTVAAIVVLAEIITMVQPYFVQHTYALGAAGSLLSPVNQLMADKLKFDNTQKQYSFNQNYTPQPSNTLSPTSTEAEATASQDPSKGITITDPQHQVDFTMTPKYSLLPGKQDGNRVIYPMSNGTGWAVYSMHAIGVKEDVLLTAASGNNMTFDYNLGLGSTLAARVDSDGGIGIYGNTLFSGNVSTSDSKDAALLQKARQNASKNTLLFEIPPPKIKQFGQPDSAVHATYDLKGDDLKVKVGNLNQAHFPLTIDPSIFVTTAQQFMNGNNETNVDFDVADALIEKGPTTGARFDAWQCVTGLPTQVWGAGTVAAGGYVYSVGGNSISGSVYACPGSYTYTIPTGVTTVTLKAWGGGGGGGNANTGSTGNGGNGGGGGFTQDDVSVTPGNTITVTVGSGGSAGTAAAGDGGDGGGLSGVQSSGSYIIQAGGGGGGGSGNTAAAGGNGGPGGCSTTGTSCAGAAGTGGGGGGASTSAGTAGTIGTGGVAGSAGAANAGGDAGGSGATCTTSVTGHTGDAGGFGAGGAGGSAATCSGGGGGGSGRFGGGGGGAASSTPSRTGGGGGGGSDLVTGTNQTETIGSGTTPGQNTDTYVNGSAVGGAGGGSTATPTPTSGTSGLVAIIITGGSMANSSAVSWQQINPNDGTLESPNPGNGTCSSWCTATSYNLPQTLTNFSLVAYNGYLYALGGEDSSCTTGNGTGDSGICKTVYIAKLGANGEPELWTPNGGTPVFWNTGTNLSSPRSMEGAVAYQNRMYLLGGKTSSSGTKSVVTTVEEADITGPGTMTAWTTTGMVALPSALYGFGVQQYNGHIYTIGGASSITTGSPTTTVQYITLNPSDGTMSGSWVPTSSFTTARMTNGGNFTAVWGAYLYLSGGCHAYNSSGYCTDTTARSDTQIASINADGSIDAWTTNTSVADSRMGYSLIAWQDSLYEFGGCLAQNTSTGVCTTPTSTVECSADINGDCNINQDGDASTVSSSQASGSGNCTGGAPFQCNVPPGGSVAGDGGEMASSTVINNGFIYVVGGCGEATCSQTGSTTTGMSGNTYYAALNASGQIVSPASCSGTSYGSWCVDNTHMLYAPDIAEDKGTISQSGTTTVTGIGTTFVAGDVGNTLVYADGTSTRITARATNTSITVVGTKTVSGQTYRDTNPSYNTGTITQSGTTTITGAGTTWTAAMIGDTIVYSDGTTALVTARASNTSITVNLSKTVTAGSTYTFYVTGVGASAATVFNNTIYLVGGTDGTTTTSWTSDINYMPLNSDGSLGAQWTATGPNTSGVTGAGDSGLPIDFPTVTGAGGATTIATDGIGYSYAFTRASPSSAGTTPGNLYIFGGCNNASTGIGCGNYSNGVYKCNISTTGVVTGCTTTGQLQIDADPNNTGNQGLGLMSGTVYANYVYLIAGACTQPTGAAAGDPCGSTYSGNRQNSIFAQINNSNNIVAVSGSAWTQATGIMNPVRRRAASFGYNGYIYSLAGYSGTASLQDLLFSQIDVSTGDFGNFSTSTVQVTPRWDLRAIVSNGYVYALGGCAVGGAPTCTTMQPQVQTFQLYNNDSGAAASYSSAANTYGTSPDRIGGASTILNGYIYVVGGCTGTTDCTATTTNISYATIDSYGNIGTWTSSGNTLPASASLGWGKLLSAGGSLYYIGGQNASGTLQSNVYYSTSISSGNPSWGTASNVLPSARTQMGAAVWDNRLYVVGGGGTGTGCSGGVCNTVYISPQLSSGGNITSAWDTASTSFNVARSGLTAIAYANNLYVLGGFDGTNYLSDVQYAQLNGSSAGEVTGSWTYSTSLPGPISQGDGFAVNGYMYLIGGRSNSTTCAPNTLVAPISANTTISSGNNPTGLGSWYETNQNYATSRYGNAALYSNGKIIVVGGACGTSLVYPTHTGPINTIQESALLTQPQVAQYSIMFDTDTDVNPIKWLLNGIDNSIGAQWQLSYRSQSITTKCNASAMTTWGQTTNFGNVTLDTPGVYNALNGSGTNINCSRFFYMYVSVDSSQAYGYPDSVTRGPTITDLTLEKSDDPAKRLMHGRTFTGELQQPDDTPF